MRHDMRSAVCPGHAKEHTSDDEVSSHMELRSILRDKLDNAVASALASKLDEILAAKNRNEVLDLIAEALAVAVSDELIQRFIDLVTTASSKNYQI